MIFDFFANDLKRFEIGFKRNSCEISRECTKDNNDFIFCKDNHTLVYFASQLKRIFAFLRTDSPKVMLINPTRLKGSKKSNITNPSNHGNAKYQQHESTVNIKLTIRLNVGMIFISTNKLFNLN